MSVSNEVSLPDQDANGGVITLRPLGGNGFDSPHSMYMCRDIQVAGDAGGGTASLRINTDPRYESIVQLVACAITSDVASTEVRLSVYADKDRWWTALSADTFWTTLDGISTLTWNPSAIVKASSVRLFTGNVDTESYRLGCIIYNFDIRASELIPLNVLVAALPRAASALG